jgi:hypothetical protein
VAGAAGRLGRAVREERVAGRAHHGAAAPGQRIFARSHPISRISGISRHRRESPAAAPSHASRNHVSIHNPLRSRVFLGHSPVPARQSTSKPVRNVHPLDIAVSRRIHACVVNSANCAGYRSGCGAGGAEAWYLSRYALGRVIDVAEQSQETGSPKCGAEPRSMPCAWRRPRGTTEKNASALQVVTSCTFRVAQRLGPKQDRYSVHGPRESPVARKVGRRRSSLLAAHIAAGVVSATLVAHQPERRLGADNASWRPCHRQSVHTAGSLGLLVTGFSFLLLLLSADARQQFLARSK